MHSIAFQAHQTEYYTEATGSNCIYSAWLRPPGGRILWPKTMSQASQGEQNSAFISPETGNPEHRFSSRSELQ